MGAIAVFPGRPDSDTRVRPQFVPLRQGGTDSPRHVSAGGEASTRVRLPILGLEQILAFPPSEGRQNSGVEAPSEFESPVHVVESTWSNCVT